jgi:hypothetical protein
VTNGGDTTGTNTAILADGIDLTRLAVASAAAKTTGQVDKSHRFWASGARLMGTDERDIMEVSFGGKRIVNWLSFKVSRFPVVVSAQYLDKNGDWQGLTYAKSDNAKGAKREIARQRTQMVVSSSVPAVVDSARATAHPQHFGKDHWESETWKVNPVLTSKIRFILRRNVEGGRPPRNHHNKVVPYSVAIKDLEIGYRVLSRADLPRVPPSRTGPNRDEWGSSNDILGSRTVYSTYEQPAGAAIDGSRETYWRCEPQPFGFAVVNMFLDLRDATGTAPVIDRFWIDPVTTGVLCNVYYSDSAPVGAFDGLSEPIPLEYRSEVGAPRLLREPSTDEAYAIELGPDTQTGVETSNVYVRMRYSEPWWVGVDGEALSDLDGNPHPIVSLGTTRLLQDGNTLTLVAQSGEAASIDLDPAMHLANSRFRVVASYFPAPNGRLPYLRLTYMLEGYDPISIEMAVSPLTDVDSPVRIGLHTDPDSDTISSLRVRGLVVKSEPLTDDTEDWFLSEGETFVADAPTVQDDRGTAENARVRMHPTFASQGNIFGVVGGAGDRFGEMVWTPVSRDYTLKQGYMHIPPTKAKYWKFEMTRLLPQVYENFVTIDREVLVFPPDVVEHHASVTGKRNNNSTPSGVSTIGDRSISYADALNALAAEPAAADATQVLIVKDPTRAAQIAKSGWVWSYQPWHVGSAAPQFMGSRTHSYEAFRVRHTTKVAFFAAIREITPYRVDYTFDDDTPEYVEHLLDDEFVSSMDGLEHFEGGVRATSTNAEIVSKTLSSYRSVRGVQFATQESDAFQVLDDADFTMTAFDQQWTKYGDADLEKVGANDVLVSRGWFLRFYSDMEQKTYGDLDGTSVRAAGGQHQRQHRVRRGRPGLGDLQPLRRGQDHGGGQGLRDRPVDLPGPGRDRRRRHRQRGRHGVQAAAPG